MRRILSTTQHFGLRSLVCINKADIHPPGTQEIEAFCLHNGTEVIGRIPFDEEVTQAVIHAQPVTEYHPHAPASLSLIQIWQHILAVLRELQR